MKNIVKQIIVSICCLLAAGTAHAVNFVVPIEPPEFGYCYVQNYVDVDIAGGGQDYYGELRSYESHRGTDFRVSYNAMLEGVAVRAAADGTVLRTRDGMEDAYILSMAKSVDGQECGNGVIIGHDDGWQTQYCHLKEGSILVKPGDAVKSGTPIAKVGLSGKTEFAHLHFQVTRNGLIVCPFSGAQHKAESAPPALNGAWKNEKEEMLRYAAPQLLRVDYSDFLPASSRDVLRRPPSKHVLSVNNKPLIFSVVMAMLDKGDKLIVRLNTLKGKELAKKVVEIKDYTAQRFDFVGRKDSQAFVGQTLEGQVELWRGDVCVVQHRSLVVVR